MNGKDGFGSLTVSRMRNTEGLICQVRKEHLELNRLWEGFEKGTIDEPGIDDLVGLMCSIRVALGALDELKREDIEGVLWTGSEDIRQDISEKEMSLKGYILL